MTGIRVRKWVTFSEGSHHQGGLDVETSLGKAAVGTACDTPGQAVLAHRRSSGTGGRPSYRPILDDVPA